MKFRRQFILKIKERRGAVIITVAVMLIVLLGFTALAVDDSSGNTNKTYLNGSLS